MHAKRLIMAAIFVPLLYLYVMCLPPHYYLLLVCLISTIGLIELYTMFRISGILRYAGVLWGGVLLTVFFLAERLFTGCLMLAALTIMTIRLFSKRDPRSSFSDITAVVFGLIYIPCLFTFQLSLVKASPAWIIMLFAAIWGADSMAFYVGSSIGRRKLYAEMSPNKTMEGAIGSVIGGIIGAALIKATLLQHVSVPQMLILGGVVGFATIFGDLVESMFKRDAGVKDSGSILPGHGGILDKIDGATFAGPALFWTCASLGLIQ